MLQRRPMKARFKMPISEEKAYAYCWLRLWLRWSIATVSSAQTNTWRSNFRRWLIGLPHHHPHFGILLCGECGNGKSTMLKAFQQLQNTQHIPKPYNEGTYGIRIVDAKYITHLCKNNYEAYRKLISVDMLGIDDFGTEPSEVLDYGNVYTPVIDLLTKRYEEPLFTIITTNLTPQQIREHYGDRIADRLNEMVKKIVFSNGTYRTDKLATPVLLHSKPSGIGLAQVPDYFGIGKPNIPTAYRRKQFGLLCLC